MLRKRCETAEARGVQHRRLLGFCQWGMHLLRGIFEEIRENWSFQDKIGAEEDNATPGGTEGESAANNGERDSRVVLRRIVSLFCTFVPKLGNFAELLAALEETLADTEEVTQLKQGVTCSQTCLGGALDATLPGGKESPTVPDPQTFGLDSTDSLAMRPDDPQTVRHDSAESVATVSESERIVPNADRSSADLSPHSSFGNSPEPHE